MEEMRKRFEEIIKFEKKSKGFHCSLCPCSTECGNLIETEHSCEDIYFAYITLGPNFDLKSEKIIKIKDIS